MQISNKIVLRPRFTLELNADPNLVLEAFEAAKNSQDAIKINVLDAHVFLKIPCGTTTLLVATTPFRSFRELPKPPVRSKVYLAPALRFGRCLCFFIL